MGITSSKKDGQEEKNCEKWGVPHISSLEAARKAMRVCALADTGCKDR
jgi:hypothetical protein